MRYILRRLGFYLIALWAATTINFFLPRLMPGDPLAAAEAQIGPQLANNPNALNALRVLLGGSTDPLPIQYIHYLGQLLHGNFGTSTSLFPTPVSYIIGQTLPWTLFLVGALSTVPLGFEIFGGQRVWAREVAAADRL